MITQERLKELLDYNPDTGAFVWKPRRWFGRGGQTAGSLSNQGYIRIFVNGRNYLAHRLAWLYEYGSFPIGILDHINGNPLDNKIVNLRAATASQNLANMKCLRTGLKGAQYYKRYGNWKAMITKDQVRRHIGYFNTEQEAHEAYMAAARVLHGEFARAI